MIFSPNIYILFIVWLSIIAYIWYSFFFTPKILIPQNKISQSKKIIRNANKYIYILLSIIIPLNIYIPSSHTWPKFIISIDSSLSMSATDLQSKTNSNRSEYISDIIKKSTTNLPNKFTINTFDAKVHEIASYISSDQISNQLKQIKLWVWSALGDALIYDHFLLSHWSDMLILATDWSANIWYNHHQALDQILLSKKPIILLAISNTGYKIATDKNNQDIYISSDTGFINKILSYPINSWIIINASNQDKFSDWSVLADILRSYNQKYSHTEYIYINYIIWLIWIIQSLRLLRITLKSNKKYTI